MTEVAIKTFICLLQVDVAKNQESSWKVELYLSLHCIYCIQSICWLVAWLQQYTYLLASNSNRKLLAHNSKLSRNRIRQEYLKRMRSTI